MLHNTQSPLIPLRLSPAPERALKYLDGLGAALDMMRNMKWHGRLPISTVVPLVMDGLRESRIHFALTDDDRPWGLAIWHWVNEATHQRWLSEPPSLEQIAQIRHTFDDAEFQSKNLWFSLLITPFCSSIQLLEQMQYRLPQANSAWAITPYTSEALTDAALGPKVRSIW